MKLETRQITKVYGEKHIIEDISLHLEEGEIVGLLGASGVGKTTLFHVISGLVKPDSGSVWLDGQEITGKPGNISYMLQKDLMMPYKTIIDNVSLPLRIQGKKKQEAIAMAQRHFSEFGLGGTEKKYPSQLSGGMRQRAALLRTYLASQGVALLDEPFSALDAITKRKMHHWYLEIMEQIQLSTIFITHDIDEAILLSDRIYLMTGHPGKLTKEIRIEEPKPRREAFMLSAEFIQYKREIMDSLK